jgi:hypothetical protein
LVAQLCRVFLDMVYKRADSPHGWLLYLVIFFSFNVVKPELEQAACLSNRAS